MPDELKKKEAPFLVVDVSNSFTKYAVATPGRLLRGQGGTCPTPSLNLATVRALARRFKGKAVFLSSVVPARTKIFRRVFGRRLHVLHGEAVPLGMPVRYPNKARIGPDRLANALAVRSLYGAPAVVIDFGTAVTFDVIDRDGAYCGGVIAPGLNMMTEYLHERTALLPRVEVREPRRAIGKSTEEAIRVGAVIGYRGMIREILGAVRSELLAGKKPKGTVHVVATGGQAGIVARAMPEVAAVVPGLTLDGLRLWAGTVLASI
ncbi:type III pantothenate kinase [Verrucomicrobium sp. GAS474]|uniref:type III pantothenate kinase n=1 Tax=Verrucomicrobium sp. GAS474 TaxID=1882831 RepID=UPI00087928C8|nr:type III pantothenate kinase [Verrucomicrobium sp. GAS474]SDU00113.1 type III pantothenate kinase [Verrucomicrobium sp. GAS474]